MLRANTIHEPGFLPRTHIVRFAVNGVAHLSETGLSLREQNWKGTEDREGSFRHISLSVLRQRGIEWGYGVNETSSLFARRSRGFRVRMRPENQGLRWLCI